MGHARWASGGMPCRAGQLAVHAVGVPWACCEGFTRPLHGGADVRGAPALSGSPHPCWGRVRCHLGRQHVTRVQFIKTTNTPKSVAVSR